MPDVSIFNVAGTAINVKDATARSQAANALSTAQGAKSTADTANTTAQGAKTAAATAQETAEAAQTAADSANNTAKQALDLAQNIEDLTRVEVTYESASETIKITNGTHKS